VPAPATLRLGAPREPARPRGRLRWLRTKALPGLNLRRKAGYRIRPADLEQFIAERCEKKAAARQNQAAAERAHATCGRWAQEDYRAAADGRLGEEKRYPAWTSRR
jgi:hypothetical protein